MRNVYAYTLGDGKIIERILSDGQADINHMVLPPGEALPIHETNSNVYLILTRGAMSISLNDSDFERHEAGSIMKIDYRTKMDVQNRQDKVLEFFVVKAPSPGNIDLA